MDDRSPPSAVDPRDTPLDTIEVAGIRATCIIGVYPHERSMPQPLDVDLAIGLDARRAAHDETVHGTVDYARLTREVQFLLQACRFHLLETAAAALCSAVVAAFPVAARVRARLSKPSALGDGVRASVVVERRAVELPIEHVRAGAATVAAVFAGRACAIFRVQLPPGASVVVEPAAEVSIFDAGRGLAGEVEALQRDASAGVVLENAARSGGTVRELLIVVVPPCAPTALRGRAR